jgi:mRNA-degrading endonuclease RelE of RelBE toxin-antitoxin system
MEVHVNSAIRAQLSTLPDSDQAKTESILQKLTQGLPRTPNIRRLRGNGDLWELRITSRLRALLRIENDRVEVLAVARPDQLQRYWRRELVS